MNYSEAMGVAIVRPAGVASGQLVPSSPYRVGLVLTSAGSGIVTYSPSNPAVLGQGIVLAAGTEPLILTIDQVGQLVQREWNVIHSVGGLSVEVYEIYNRVPLR